MSVDVSSLAFLQGGGEMGERIRGFDWASHPLGPPQHWPPALRVTLSVCLNSSFPTCVYWGPECFLLYNDAWSAIPADRHPHVLGMPAREAWRDIWPIIQPQFAHVLGTGEGVALYEQMLPMERAGVRHETWWNYSLTAIRNPDNSIGGIFNQGNEITGVVMARRERLAEVERLRGIFSQAPSPIALLRGPQHVFEIANDSYLRLVGNRDILGKPVAQALPEVVGQGYLELLDRVYDSGEAYIASAQAVRLLRGEGQTPEDVVLDFVYQPVLDAARQVEAIFVQVNDVTERARAETALRLSNWQLGEERARLAATVQAEQAAQNALRRFTSTLEANVRARTAELTTALEARGAVAHRLRATFETPLIYQGYMDPAGTLLDANSTALAGIGKRLDEVVGQPFWETPWFTGTPGMAQVMKRAVASAGRGHDVHETLELDLPAGRRKFDFYLRAVFGAGGEVIGLVPEAVDITQGVQPRRAG